MTTKQKQQQEKAGLQRLRSLRSLWVNDCPEFLSNYSSSNSFLPFPNCLQDLSLTGVKHMETLQALSNLTSLTQLDLSGCEGSRDEGLWPLLAHGRLTKLTLEYIPDFFAYSDPSRPHDTEVSSRSSNLLDLNTSTNTGFLAAPICSLLSSTLTRLDLWFNDEVQHLTKEQEEALQLLTCLQDLRFFGGKKLQHLPAELHKLTNLEKLNIWLCSAIQSLPSLPSSLQELKIYGCGALKSLPNSLPSSLEILDIFSCSALKSLPNSLPSSLEKLKIYGCKAIKSLPKDGLPSSMRELDVHDGNSEELKRACRKLIGTIPIIRARPVQGFLRIYVFFSPPTFFSPPKHGFRVSAASVTVSVCISILHMKFGLNLGVKHCFAILDFAPSMYSRQMRVISGIFIL